MLICTAMSPLHCFIIVFTLILSCRRFFDELMGFTHILFHVQGVTSEPRAKFVYIEYVP